jgi:alpha-N-arabinofuranosidase
LKTRIAVDAGKVEARIDRRIYGHFIENMARCIYGGLMVNERTGDPRGPWKIRDGIVETIKELEPPVIRWPGGLYADGYHWRDGIGPADERPLKRNRYWSRYGPATRVLDPNAFGSHEYMALMEALDARPYVNVNFGTGSADEAARWVEYMNGSAGTSEGTRRASHGREEPWDVRTWGIGNEMYGIWALGHTTPVDYAHRYIEFRKAMGESDPGLEYVAVGADHDFNKDWNREVLSIAADAIDLLSVHVYLPGPERIAGVLASRARGGAAAMYKAIVASPVEYERRLRLAVGDIESVAGKDSGIGIAFDEWNLWWTPLQLLFPRWTLRDALFACGVFHAMHRLAGRVRMANVAQLFNVLGLITTLGDRVCRTALYYPFLMYSRLAQPLALRSEVACNSFETPRVGGIPAMSGVQALDCSATASEDKNTLVLFVINRLATKSVQADIELAGFSPTGEVEVHTLDGPSAAAVNTYGDDEIVRVVSRHLDVGDALPRFGFPPHSATALVFKA